jgi:hypothetical protein
MTAPTPVPDIYADHDEEPPVDDLAEYRQIPGSPFRHAPKAPCHE